MQGYTVIDAPSVLVTHLTEILKKVSAELLSRDDVKALLDNVKESLAGRRRRADPERPEPRPRAGRPRPTAPRGRVDPQPPGHPRGARRRRQRDEGPAGPHREGARRTSRARSSTRSSTATGTLHAATIEPQLEKALADADGRSRRAPHALPQGFLSRFVDGTAQALASMANGGREPGVDHPVDAAPVPRRGRDQRDPERRRSSATKKPHRRRKVETASASDRPRLTRTS